MYTNIELSHLIKQYVYGPSKKTFWALYCAIREIVNSYKNFFYKSLKIRVQTKPLVGFVLVRLGNPKKPFNKILSEILRYMKQLYKIKVNFA
jgi:hypothetical protein